MNRERKIRNLVETNGDDITLMDVINLLISASESGRELEYGNVNADLIRHKRVIKKARATLELYWDRVRGDVTTEVNNHRTKNKHKYPGNPDALEKAREILNSNKNQSK